MSRFADEELTRFHEDFLSLKERFYSHLNGEDPLPKSVVDIIDRFETLEMEFTEHKVSSDQFRLEVKRLVDRFEIHAKVEEEHMVKYVAAQEDNTKALTMINITMQKQLSDTAGIIELFSNVKSAVIVLDKIGAASTWILKLIAVVGSIALAIWVWAKGFFLS